MNLKRKVIFVTMVGVLLLSLSGAAAFASENENYNEENNGQSQFKETVVFEDANSNGLFDKGEVPISGVKLTLNNAYLPTPIDEATSLPNGKVFFKFREKIDGLWNYYLVTSIPAGYQINPASNSLFGQDGKTGYCTIAMKNTKIDTFGGQSTVYVPLIKATTPPTPTIITTTMEILTANSTDSSKVYPGVTYDLYQSNQGTFVKIDSQTSDSAGIVRFSNVNTEFDVYIRATNLSALGLAPYEFLGADSNSAYIKLTAPKVSILVTAYEI